MSGPLASVLDRIAGLGTSRAEARAKATIRRLAGELVPIQVRHQPPVREFGDFQAARAILKGDLTVGGYATRLRDLTPWELAFTDSAIAQAMHGFRWLDDFAALGTKPARERAQGWVLGWLDRFEDGSGPGWTPEATARRFLRILTHLPFLEKSLLADYRSRVMETLALHAAYLDDTSADPASLAGRMTAISARIHAGLCFEGGEDRAFAAGRDLSVLAQQNISDTGAIPSRNPQELLSVFKHLLWLRALAKECDTELPEAASEALHRIAPVLRGLRLGDGSLVRFHGGGAGAEGELDAALADSGDRTRPTDAPSMGFARLGGARTVVVVDVARPPKGHDTAHASTLGIEMSSGRRQILANTGPALTWISDWDRLPRTTAAHNTLSLDKTSSSRFGPARASGRAGQDALLTRPALVTLTRARDGTGCWMQARHDGYLEDYGLLHERRLFVSANGRELHGEDVLLSPDQKAQRRFQTRIKGAAQLGVAVNLNFHVHPEVEVQIDRATDVVHLSLLSGEVWLFRHSGGLMDVEPSVYIADPLAAPVESRQIVIRNHTQKHEVSFGWSLVREDDATRAVRDVGIDAHEPSGH